MAIDFRVANPFDTFNAVRKTQNESMLADAQAREQIGRANYFDARAKEYAPPPNAMQTIEQLRTVMANNPPDSPQYMWANRALGNIVNQGNPYSPGQPGHSSHGGGMGGGGAGSAGGTGMMIDPQSGQLIVNPESGKRSGVQFAKQNPDGTWTTYSTPTTAATSSNQQRESAHEEMMGLYKNWEMGMAPYVGTGGALALAQDKLAAAMGSATDEQRQRLTNYAQARKIQPELAKNIDAFSSRGNTSIEGTRAIEKSALGTNWLTPQSVAQQAMADYPNVQSQAFNQSLQPNAQDYPVTMQGAPVYADPGFEQQPQSWNEIVAAYNKQKNSPKRNSKSSAPRVSSSNPFSDLVGK